jgi:hypothetical protein
MRWRVIPEKKFSTALSQEAGVRGEVEGPALMARQPSQHLGVVVGRVVVEHRVDQLAGRDLALNAAEEADEFGVAVALNANYIH